MSERFTMAGGFTRALLLLAAAAASAHAGSVPVADITFLGAATGVNDGVDFVLPYQISVNQGSGAVVENVICYDTYDQVSLNETWTANLFNLSEAVADGFFSQNPNALAGYEEVSWLSAQSYSGTDQQVALQHAIWDVFGEAPAAQNAQQTADTIAYQNAAASAAASGYSGFDFSKTVFVEEVGATSGAPGTAQAFVFQQVNSLSGSAFGTPEPGTTALLIGGLMFLAIRKYYGRTAAAAAVKN